MPRSSIMKFLLNGNEIDCQTDNLLEVLAHNGYANLDGCAVAINDKVVPKSLLSETQLQAGAKILIITATQGGWLNLEKRNWFLGKRQ